MQHFSDRRCYAQPAKSRVLGFRVSAQLETDLTKAVQRKEADVLEAEWLLPLWDAAAERRRELRELRELPAAFRHTFAPSLEVYKTLQSGKGEV